MYSTNSERNRVIYELWENGLTVNEIFSQTKIPRSTIGYYVRKFNKLAAKGKPIAFLGSNHNPKILSSYAQNIPPMSNLEVKILSSMVHGDWEGIYYRLRTFKLLKELDLLTTAGQASFRARLEFWLDYKLTERNFEFVESWMRLRNQR